MAEGSFLIQELQFQSGQGFIADPEGERFIWSSDRTAPTDLGGARATPLQPWTFGGKLRTTRTDYPGAKTPSEQVLGPNHTPFTLKGRWDDRYNFAGYAVQEMRRFEAMARRGRLLLMQFQDQSFNVLITDWNFEYKREWEIGYQFTVSNHDRPDDFDPERLTRETPKSVSEILDEHELAVQILNNIQAQAPTSAFQITLLDDINDVLAEANEAMDRFSDTFDRVNEQAATPIDQFKRMATHARRLEGKASEIIEAMVATKADTSLGVRTALSVLDFEAWSRSLRFQSRVLLGTSSNGAREIEERSDPEAISIYRPFKGESLYSISQRFYGTPNAWRLIADRNSLRVFVLEGDEVLIIPERGEG